MNRDMKKPRQFSSVLLVVAALFAVAPAWAQQPAARRRPSTSTQAPLEVITNFKLRADPVEPADFVKRTRPPEDRLDYVPVGGPRPEPASKIMSFEELKAREAELDAIRARHDGIGGRKRPAGPVKSVAYEPKKPSPRKRQPCLITCTVETRPQAN